MTTPVCQEVHEACILPGVSVCAKALVPRKGIKRERGEARAKPSTAPAAVIGERPDDEPLEFSGKVSGRDRAESQKTCQQRRQRGLDGMCQDAWVFLGMPFSNDDTNLNRLRQRGHCGVVYETIIVMDSLCLSFGPICICADDGITKPGG